LPLAVITRRAAREAAFFIAKINGLFSIGDPMHNTALILIDMQQGMQSPQLPPRNNPDAEAHIMQLLAAWREAARPVVHVRHMSRTPASVFFPGQSGALFQAPFVPLADEHIVEKNVPDAFIQSGLERWLHVRGIRAVVIVGVSTNHSVESTARTAGNLGFDTTVIADATFAFAQDDYNGVPRSAEDVHGMSLANLQREYATICTTAEILSKPPLLSQNQMHNK
jgi:nicotinamidase-related amidase